MTDATFSRPGAVDLSSLAQAAPAAAAGGFVIDLTEATFQEVAGSSMQYPVILAFHSAHDPQGAAVGETLASLVNAAGGRFLLARVDVDAEPRLAQGLGVQGVPTVVALIGGQMAPLFQGTRAADEIAALLDQVAQLAVANGIPAREAILTPYDLYNADECFLTGTGAKLIPVREIDGRKMAECPGTYYQQLTQAFSTLIQQETGG